MKAISAAIVTASGIYGMVGSTGFVVASGGHAITPLLTFASCLAIPYFGLTSWFACLKYDR